MPPKPASLYDEVLYPSIALPQTHPDRLATMGVLFGLEPAPVSGCRVLEIGCGDGANLLPMASALPGSAFVGIDHAGQPIAAAKTDVDALRLDNVVLAHQDLMSLASDAGTFDYIIAHGVYSWTPPGVRDRLLAVCRRHLAPHGIAFVSYNVLPGGHLRRMTREMMRFHLQDVEAPDQRAGGGRAFLHWLREGQTEPGYYAALLQKEEELTSAYADEHLLHDHLAEINEPVYFHQFAAHAGRHGLQYLGEADFHAMQDTAFPAHVTEALRRLDGDPVRKEQYMDFLRCRMFRQTLLCHAEVTLRRPATPERVHTLYVAAPVREAPPKTPGGDPGSTAFVGLQGRMIRTAHPFARAVLHHIGDAWPRCVSFEALQDHFGDAPDRHLLDRLLLGLYGDGLLGLHAHAPEVAAAPGSRPLVSAVVRREAERRLFVTNRYHESIRLDNPRLRALLPLLDGSRDRDILLAAWSECLRRAAASEEALPSASELDEALTRLHHKALLAA